MKRLIIDILIIAGLIINWLAILDMRIELAKSQLKEKDIPINIEECRAKAQRLADTDYTFWTTNCNLYYATKWISAK